MLCKLGRVRKHRDFPHALRLSLKSFLLLPIIVNRPKDNKSRPEPVASSTIVVVLLILKNLRLSVHHDPCPLEAGHAIVSKRPNHLSHRKTGVDRIGAER